MSSFILRSWENEQVEIDIDSARAIGFIGHVPDPSEEIPLADLEIDIETLKLIKEFLQIKGEFPSVKSPLPASRAESIFPADSHFKGFFEKLVDDQLLLITLAAHKLEYAPLENLCVAVIASRFAEMDADEVVEDLTEEELTTNEEDFYKWIEWDWHKSS